MRHSYLFVLTATLALSACTDVRTVNTSTVQNTTVLPATSYAIAQAEPSNAKIPPSNPCAAGFDEVMTHLENLMAHKTQQQTVATAQ